jgi:rhodanese-related sulfurtransferase
MVRTCRALLPVLLLALLVAALGTACGGSSDPAPAGPDAAAAAVPDAVSAAEAGELFQTGGYTLVDVRETVETDQQQVEGSLLIPLGEVEARMGEVPDDRPVLVLCRSGSRAVPAAEAMRAAGRQATVVEGGIVAWAEAGLPYTGAAPS